MKRLPKLTIDQHRAIAEIIRDPRIPRMACEIVNHCGVSSRTGKQAWKTLKVIERLKSDLENQLCRDHPTADHTGIYYLTETTITNERPD